MFDGGILSKVRKWLTTSKTETVAGKYFADAVAVKELKDLIDVIGTVYSATKSVPISNGGQTIDVLTLTIPGTYIVIGNARIDISSSKFYYVDDYAMDQGSNAGINGWTHNSIGVRTFDSGTHTIKFKSIYGISTAGTITVQCVRLK